MKRLFKVIVVTTMLAGWPLALSAIHVVRTPGQLPAVGSMLPDWGTVHVFTKESFSFRQTFADTRQWTLEDVAKRPMLVNRMIALGLNNEIAAAGSADDIAAALRGEIRTPPVPTPPAPANATPPPVPYKVGKPVELVKPPSPATQPTAEQKKGLFDF
jgi:hypothetical protein